ncbi:MAG: C40 family peptidase [Candidatus Parcubacteria bacterium]|nr:C40 family peptidase [Burkholderiales bacterium]
MRRNNLFLIIYLLTISGCASYLPTLETRALPPSPPISAPTVPPRIERSEALLQALFALGLDYRYGGNTPVTGFDCSGLVAHVYKEAWGIRLPRNTKAQSQAGVAVSLAELQAGDLLFYDTLKRPNSHVGIYLGDGRFVHAPKAGSQVRVESIRSAYWAQRFNGARRVEPSPLL